MNEDFQERMQREGKCKLRVAHDALTDASGELRFPILTRNYGHHNKADGREDIWFTGPCGMRWQASRFGSNDHEVSARRCTGIRPLMEQLGPRGIAISLKDGEYRVNYKHGKEDTAYYTNDPVDAFNTAVAMIDSKAKATKPDA